MFRALGQVDTHQHKDWSFGLFYEGLISLLDADLAESSDGVQFVKCEFGAVGVDKWDGLGTTRRFVIGRQTHRNYYRDWRHDKAVTSPDDRTFQGKCHADLLR